MREYEVVAPIEKSDSGYEQSQFEKKQQRMQEQKAVIDFAGDIFSSFIRHVNGGAGIQKQVKLLSIVSRSSNGKVVKVRLQYRDQICETWVYHGSVLAGALDPKGKFYLTYPPHKVRRDMDKELRKQNKERKRRNSEYVKRGFMTADAGREFR